MNHKKKILFCIESLHCGGAEKSLVTLLQNLDYERYDIDLLMIKEGGEFEKWLPSSVNIIYYDTFLNFNFFSKFAFRVKYYLSKHINKRFHHAELHWKLMHKKLRKISKQYDSAISYNQGFCTYFVATMVVAAQKYT